MKKKWILGILGLSTLNACTVVSSDSMEGDWEMVISNAETSGLCLMQVDDLIGETADLSLKRDEEGLLVVEFEDVRLEAEQYLYWISAYGPSYEDYEDDSSLPVDEEYMSEVDVDESPEYEDSSSPEEMEEEWIDESEIYYMLDALLLGPNSMQGNLVIEKFDSAEDCTYTLGFRASKVESTDSLSISPEAVED